jgi:chromosome segregation protein
MHAVVLQDGALATEILRHVTSNNLGQAALALPALTAVASDDHLVDLPNGAIAWAVDKVDAPETIAPLVRRLLRGVVIVPDLETAIRLKRQQPVLQFATLAGEFISTAGVIFGGTRNAESESLLGRKALIEETAQQLSDQQAALAILEQRLEHLRASVGSASAELEEARLRHQAAHLRQSNSASQILLLSHQLRAAEEKLQQFQTERATLEQQTTFADSRITQLEEEFAGLTSSITEQQAQRTAAVDASAQAQLHEEETSEQLHALRIAVATERQRHENLLSQRQPMAAREAELAELIAARRTDIARYERRLEIQAEESRSAESALQTQVTESAAAEERVAEIAAERATRLTSVNSLESELRGIRNSLNELHDRRGKEQVRATQLQLRIDNLLEHVTRRYQLDLREFEADHYAFQKTLRVQLKCGNRPVETEGADVAPDESATTEVPNEIDAAQLEAIIAELSRQLDNMGPVNLDAVHEYDELEERHKFLETQHNDLTASRKELLEVIARINETTQKLFADTFAQVRINFREMFAELFGGGRADLSLVDEANPLECGIDIVAKPPGKQLQTVSLLSGGERTMTAVALLFAIYMVRPSPFCILDEMDAPLDESNINRFIKMLDRFIGQSQFIIITHNKRTIAKADVLYGVTMEERGISKLVGMRLAAEKGSDGQLIERPLNAPSKQKFENGESEDEPELAIGR